VHRRCLPRHRKSIRQGLARRTRAETPKPPPEPQIHQTYLLLPNQQILQDQSKQNPFKYRPPESRSPPGLRTFTTTVHCILQRFSHFRHPEDQDENVRGRHGHLVLPEKLRESHEHRPKRASPHREVDHWRVKINPTKSQSILFTFPKAQKQRTLFTQSRLIINRDVIPKNNTVQYLGITVSSTCTLHADLKATLKKARNRANLLYKIRGRLRGCAPETLLHTYNSFIRPVFEYRALLYSTLPKRAAFKIYSFERHILRDMFRLHRQHPSNTLYSYDVTKTTPISERLTLHQARYVERTLNGNNTIAKQTLHTSHKLPTKNGLLNRVPKKTQSQNQTPPHGHTLLKIPRFST
jgi:hypothetical protein